MKQEPDEYGWVPPVAMAADMSLRDWFAGQALSAMSESFLPLETAARMAYQYADAMLAERNK